MEEKRDSIMKRHGFLIINIGILILLVVVYCLFFGRTFSPFNHKKESGSFFYWSKDRPLSIADFTPTNRKKDIPGGSARTYAYYGWEFSISNDTFKYWVYDYFEKDSSLWFFKDTSFFTPAGMARHRINDKVLLRHEQAHFDLFEIFARKGRLLCSKCKKIDDTIYFNRALKDMWDKLIAVHSKYDLETDHSLITDEQNKWELRIQSMLDSLKDYENPEGFVIIK